MGLPENDASAEKTAFREEVRKNYRWNLTFNLLYGLFGTTGWQLINAPTFVPMYVYKLGGSNVLVGLLLSLGGLSRFITPPVIAPLVEHQPYLKRKVLWVGTLMRVQVLFMALAGFFLGTRLNMIAFFAAFALYNFFLGMQNVVYNTVMAKVIPIENRGRFIGWREFLGGLSFSGVALVAGVLIQDLRFPHSYGATYLLSFFLTFLGLVLFGFSREPATPTVLKKIPLFERLRSIPELMRKDRNFANYCVCRLVGSLAFMSNPFFILYMGRKLAISGELLGQLTFCYYISRTTINLLLGRIADRSGFRRVFLISVTIWTLALFALLTIPPSYTLAVAVFLALGAGFGGFMMSMSSMVLEFGETAELPMRLALVNSIGEMATSVGPLFAGFLADNVSYHAVFLISILCMTFGLAMMYFRVKEPRYAAARAVAAERPAIREPQE